MKILVQIVAYALFAAVIGLFSVWPEYRLLAEDKGIVSLAFSHAGQRVGECRILTQEELNELPPNMRKPSDCPRERHPIKVELRVNGTVIYHETSPPSGLWGDGKATVYRRLQIPAGVHDLFVGMNDSGGGDGFDYELKVRRDILPGQNLVIDFDGLEQAFVLR